MPVWIILVAFLSIAATAALTWVFWRMDSRREEPPER
jgi:hypothetical protein